MGAPAARTAWIVGRAAEKGRVEGEGVRALQSYALGCRHASRQSARKLKLPPGASEPGARARGHGVLKIDRGDASVPLNGRNSSQLQKSPATRTDGRNETRAYELWKPAARFASLKKNARSRTPGA